MKLALAALLALSACKGDAKPAPPPAVTPPIVAPPVAAPPPNDFRAASLPGQLWFVEDEPEHALVRLVGGVRFAVAAPLFPSRERLADGRLVAIRSRGDGSPDSEQLVLVAADGAQTPLGPAAPQVRDPVVAGTAIIAALQIEGRSELHRIDVATGAATRLTDNKEGNFHPVRLGADAIAFVSSRDGDSELYRMPIAGGAPTRLTAFHKDDWEPAPSPDGTTIAFLSDREGPPRIILIAADGTKFRRLSDLASTGADADLEESDPRWSPDGTRIAYLVRHRGKAQLMVRVIGAPASSTILTPADASDAEPVWSPDGAWLAVVRTVGRSSQLVALAVDRADPPIPLSRGAAQLPRWFANGSRGS